MLSRGNTGQADSGCQPVSTDLDIRVGILLCYDGSEGPGQGSMIGRKGCPSVKDDILIVGLNRRKASDAVLEWILQTKNINHCFGRQDSGFAHALIPGNSASQIRRAGEAGRGDQPSVRRSVVSLRMIAGHAERTGRISDE